MPPKMRKINDFISPCKKSRSDDWDVELNIMQIEEENFSLPISDTDENLNNQDFREEGNVLAVDQIDQASLVQIEELESSFHEDECDKEQKDYSYVELLDDPAPIEDNQNKLNSFKKLWKVCLQQNLFSSNEDELFSCSKCPFQTSTKKELSTHLFTHYEVKKVIVKDECGGGEEATYYKMSLSTKSVYFCSNCEFESHSQAEISDHIDTHNAGEGVKSRAKKKRFVCSICGYSCKDNYSLRAHRLDKHSDVRLFRCSLCRYETNKKYRLKEHLVIHNEEKKFNCTLCSYRTNGKPNFDLHVTRHSCKQYGCQDCSFETNEKRELEDHVMAFKHQPVVSDEMLNCPYCQFMTSSKLILNKHVSSHYVVGQIKCPEKNCKFRTDLPERIKNHILVHNGNDANTCSKCDKFIKSKDLLICHFLNHYNLKLLKCPKCTFRTNWGAAFNNHVNRHADVQIFRCQDCSYQTTMKPHLDKHALSHNTYKCLKCSFKSRLKADLVNHMKRHRKEEDEAKSLRGKVRGVYMCTMCDYKANVVRDLKFHILNYHSDTKLYKCSKCKFGTNRRDRLKAHVLTHLGVKLLNCTQCDFETNKKRLLLVHIGKHERKQFQCADCSHESNHKLDLENHLLASGHSAASKLITCSQCHYRTYRANNYNLHLSSHDPAGEINCPECTFKSNQMDKLSNHLLVHNDDKCFECTKCGFKSDDRKTLLSHFLGHYNLNFLKCPLCNFRTIQKRSLKAHVSNHVLKCGECGFEAKQITELKKHMARHREEEL